MIVRHYPHQNRNKRKRVVNPDLELDAAIAERLSNHRDSYNPRGVGIVAPPMVAPYTERPRVRRNEGRILPGRTKFGGTWVATEPAPYLEFASDVKMPARKVKARKATKGKVNVQTDRDIALLAKMESIHVGADDTN